MNEQTTVLNLPASKPTGDLDRRFAELAEQWRTETWPLSSMTQIVNHPAYQEIIAMGPAVIPLLLCELERDPDWWFTALSALTGENPVRPEQRGKLQEMADAWLEWGKEQGYTW